MNARLTPKTALFNPLTSDYLWVYFNTKNEEETATMPALEISYFEPWLADLMLKHLTTHLCNLRNIPESEENVKSIQEEIRVKL